MEKIIKETTEKLSKGIMTKDEADKILLVLFGVIKPICVNCNHYRNEKSKSICACCTGNKFFLAK